MRFEWDPAKNESNIERHSLDLTDAWQIFEGPILTGVDNRIDYGEVRKIGIGILHNHDVVLIFTERDNDIIRVISLRRARKDERDKFYRSLQDRLGKTEDDV